MKEKVDIIARLKKGETGRALVEKYGVGTSTISDIKKNADSITRYVNNLDDANGSLTRKTMKKPKTELLEDAVFTWFMQNRASGLPISDETGLNWKALSSKSLVSQREATAPGYKLSKDRVTVMVCANATGTHKIPLLLIGKSKNPRCFKNVKIPLTYKSQKNAWMNADLFVEWFQHTFVPEVKPFQQNIGKEGKVLLLLSNAPSHPSTETLNAINDKFEVKFFPSNVTSLIQPMDQNVIETLKRLYRKELMRRLLIDDQNDEESFLSFYKKINLKDCCYMLVGAWKCVQNCTLERSWNKLLKQVEDTQNVEPNVEIAEIQECISQVHVFSDCDEENISEWLLMDTNDPGYQILSDDKIVRNLFEEDETEEEENETDDLTEGENGPSHSKAFDALDLVFKWFERQEESNTTQLLQLRRLRDLALNLDLILTDHKSLS
ncbi:hypothetical protein QTP88_010808 [Uroleucon formosanum]